MERTVYRRVLGPFDYQVLPTFKGTLADLLKLDISGTEPSSHTMQLRFVVYWVEYLMKPSAHKIQDTLEAFDNLCEDNRLATFLEELLRADGEEPDHAAQIESPGSGSHIGAHACRISSSGYAMVGE